MDLASLDRVRFNLKLVNVILIIFNQMILTLLSYMNDKLDSGRSKWGTQKYMYDWRSSAFLIVCINSNLYFLNELYSNKVLVTDLIIAKDCKIANVLWTGTVMDIQDFRSK